MVDVNLVERAALLHDISKFRCLKGNIHHTRYDRNILMKMGFRKIAGVVEKYALDNILIPGRLKT